MTQLEAFGNASTKKTLMSHGAREPLFGVKVEDLKKILKKTKKNHALSLELYDTGNSDAMYLAALMADETQLTEAQLEQWVEQAYWFYLNEFAVPWVAAETPFGFSLGLKWIESTKETTAAAGWGTLASIAALKTELDVETYSKLLDRIEKEIHTAPNRVRYVMNGFLIAIGSAVPELNAKALAIAAKVGSIRVDMGGTACKVPLATEYIQKVMDKGGLGKKRKSARC
jgi:3-methyladenine DNA glycosylase AlkD